jgi:branched-chain amino acid transport system permease protein
MTAVAATRVPTSLAAWRGVIAVGLLGVALALYLVLVGIVPVFAERPLVSGLISLGEATLVLTAIAIGYLASRKAPDDPILAVLGGALAGLMSGGVLSLLILIAQIVPVRSFLPNASPAAFELLTLGSEPPAYGFWIPAAMGASLGALGAVLALLPRTVRWLLILSFGAVVVVGLFSGIVRPPMLNGPLAGLARQLFASQGVTLMGALIAFGVVAIAWLIHERFHLTRRAREMPDERKRAAAIPLSLVLILIVLWLPLGLGPQVAQVIALIALYILMALGLNITLGLAGLLDLGFVAFFAVGAYTVGLLTSTAEYGIADWPFWLAIPVAIIVAMAFGVLLGLPILGIRGDYLAIATLGFGEIIAILARSDLMKPVLGGPRGIINIPKPVEVPPTDFLAGPNQIFYISLACAAVIAFVAWRLRGSRLGRAWVAIREDEDVAEALGINLVQTKTLAYMLGAAFAGLGGAVFAALFGSIFPSSINLFVSINVVAIVIVGGLGSIPGVVLGALFLIGLPELFRELGEFRFLFYGVALILMMRFRPEGFMPSKIGQAEMHMVEETVPETVMEEAPSEPTGETTAARA